MIFKALIQARMSSSRYPGKVLAPLNGEPVIMHVLERVKQALHSDNIIVLTSLESSDTPLAIYLQSWGIRVFRGSLNNVFMRFRDCLFKNECDYFFRVCADSPFLEPSLYKQALNLIEQDNLFDIITNKHPQTFPLGKSLELIKTETFLNINCNNLTWEEKEHVTKYFYNNSSEYSIYNIERQGNSFFQDNYSIDTVEDLKRLEQIIFDEKCQK